MNVLGLTRDGIDKPGVAPLGTATIGTIDVPLCAVGAAAPRFDTDDAANARRVLVRIEAVSANFRDKGICLMTAEQLAGGNGGFVGFFGSEFCGRVVATGPEVTDLAVGDRVIADATYPRREDGEVPPGIVTNVASRGWLVVDERQLLAVPATMSSVEAAAFSLGAQTAQSMVRRTEVRPGERVLVMSGRSNTSLFLTHLAVAAGARVTVTSHGGWSAEQRATLPDGVELREGSAWMDDDAIGLGRGDFDVVLDPFFDLNLRRAVRVLDIGGRYATCGFQAQHESFASDDADSEGLGEIMTTALIKNLALIGNCIGLRADLEHALAVHAEGKLPVRIDSVWRPADGVRFVERTFTDPDRFGKVVLSYV